MLDQVLPPSSLRQFNFMKLIGWLLVLVICVCWCACAHCGAKDGTVPSYRGYVHGMAHQEVPLLVPTQGSSEFSGDNRLLNL